VGVRDRGGAANRAELLQPGVKPKKGGMKTQDLGGGCEKSISGQRGRRVSRRLRGRRLEVCDHKTPLKKGNSAKTRG